MYAEDSILGMSLFDRFFYLFRGAIYIGVRDRESAIAWYKEKFDISQTRYPMAEDMSDTSLVSRNGKLYVEIGKPNAANAQRGFVPLIYVRNIQKARDWLSARNVSAGPIATDGQTQYFEIRDPENNMIEICKEP